ncbi:MAG: ParB/RepB/Spo0J family partition protein [Candidatus Neomarinimicrobiota bacterium]
MTIPTKRLGRGLEALIPPRKTTKTPPAGVTRIPLTKIKTNPQQPRKNFDDQALSELTDSIISKGVITPITVKTDGNGYIIVAGERRLRAAKKAKLKEIPAYLIEVKGEEEMMEMALIENIQRENLNAIEEAEAYAVLQGQFNLGQNQIAKNVGKSRTAITNSLRLLRLPPQIKKCIREGLISAGHGRALLTLKTTPAMLKLWQRILDQQLSVRQVESLVKEGKENVSKKRSKKIKPAAVRAMENELISILGTRVRLQTRGKKGGRVLIDYYSNEDLERLLDLLRTLN